MHRQDRECEPLLDLAEAGDLAAHGGNSRVSRRACTTALGSLAAVALCVLVVSVGVRVKRHSANNALVGSFHGGMLWPPAQQTTETLRPHESKLPHGARVPATQAHAGLLPPVAREPAMQAHAGCADSAEDAQRDRTAAIMLAMSATRTEGTGTHLKSQPALDAHGLHQKRMPLCPTEDQPHWTQTCVKLLMACLLPARLHACLSAGLCGGLKQNGS